MSIVLVILTTILDRLRGSGKFPKAICQILYGLVIGVFLKQEWQFVVLFTILFVAGVSPGWGQPLGAYLGSRPPEPNKKERWQFGSLPQRPFESVLVRGVIWAAPPAILVFWYKEALIFSLSIMVAFPLAATIAKNLIKRDVVWWDRHEFIRGFLVGSFCVLLSLLFKASQ